MRGPRSFDTPGLKALGVDVDRILGPEIELRHFTILPTGELDIAICGYSDTSNVEQAEHRAELLTGHVLAALGLDPPANYRTDEFKVKRTTSED